MLDALLRLAVHRRVAALIATLMIGAYGVHAWLKTPIEAFPDVTNVQVNVIAQFPGYAPEEVERRVTIALERVLNGTPNMIQLRSESLFGLSLLTLTFDDAAEPFRLRTIVSQRLMEADLPEGVVPVLGPEATPLGKVYQFRLKSDRHDNYALRSEMEWRVVPYLKQIQGVADVLAFGGFIRELHIEVDPKALQAYDLTLLDLIATIEGSNMNIGGGFMVHGQQELLIRSVGDDPKPEALKALVVGVKDGKPILVGDVARLIQGAFPRRGSVGLNLEPEIVEGFVVMRRGENPSEVIDAVKARIAELENGILPEGMQVEVYYDRSQLVGLTLDTTYHNLFHGFLLIASMVWLFLRSWRATLAVAIVIPLSLLTAFIGLSAIGLPANLISMGAIDFGILVDGSVVVVESVLHTLAHHPARSRRELLARILEGARAVVRPTFFAMAIILASLLPIFALQQVEGRIFRPLALTYGFALLGALLCSLTIVPAVLALTFKHTHTPPTTPRFLQRLTQVYRHGLKGLLQRRWLAIGMSAVLLGGAAWVAPRLGTEFLPELDEGDMVVFVELPPSVDLATGQSLLLEVRRRLLAFPEVKSALTDQGRPEDGTNNEGVNMGLTFVHLKPQSQWRPGLDPQSLSEQIRSSLSELPGVRFNFSQPIKDAIEEAISGVRGKVVLKVYGEALEDMRAWLEAVKGVLSKVEGIVDLDLYRDAQTPQLQLNLNREALAREGIRIAEAQTTIEAALSGRLASEVWLDGRPVAVRVLLESQSRNHIQAIEELLIPNAKAIGVPLSELARIELAEGRASINRENSNRFLALKFNVEGRDLGSVVQEAIALVAEHAPPLPKGSWSKWGGEFENQARAVERLQVIVPIALLIVLGLLFMSLGTMRSAFTILAMIPLGLVGGLVGLWVMDIALSVSAAVGFIALLGQVALMGLLVLSAIEDQRHQDIPLLSAIIDGSSERLRAILLATLLGILGLLPMVLATGVGSETSKPFAVVLVFGLVTTLVVSLLVLPCLYLSTAPPLAKAASSHDEELS